MAVYRWIYGNAKMEGNKKDYHVRLCDPGLESCKKTLILLSKRLLSTEKRYGNAERQNCWFAGYIDRMTYMVAVGGDQKELLGISPDGYRSQHCVLAYAFTENDIRLYQKNETLFNPLKEIMREIQRKGEDLKSAGPCMTGQDYSVYADSEEAATGNSLAKPEDGYNIIASTEKTDGFLWKQSLQRPVMTGILSVDDAKKLLKLFPDGIVTVMENVKLQYLEKKETGADFSNIIPKNKTERISVSEKGNILKYPPEPETSFPIKSQSTKKKSLSGKKRQIEEKRIHEIVEKRALWCKDKLPPRQRAGIKKTIEKLGAEKQFQAKKSFLKQIEYYGYLFFWQKCRKGEPQEDERYIDYSLKIWADRMENEEQAVKHNLMLTKTIKELRHTSTDGKG